MLELQVTAKRHEAEGVFSFELRAPDGGELPPFGGGAHVDVELGDGLLRQYSLCNAPAERHRYLIAVRLADDSGGGSRHLHEHVEPGQRLRVGAPRNLFALAPGGCHLLVGAGIGITPLLAMAEELAVRGEPFELHYRARSPAHAAFLERLRAAPYAERVHLHFERASFVPQTLLGAPAADRHLYVCGPSSFMQQVLAEAARLGWPESHLHREYFAAAAQASGMDGAFEVEIASTGAIHQVPADRSVAEVLEEAGVPVALSCGQGICGSCLTGVLAGEPEHRDLVLSEEEQARNDLFTPCCSRARSKRLVLDL